MITTGHARFMLISVTSLLLAQGCASIAERKPVPEELLKRAVIPGVPMARSWGDEIPKDIKERIELVRSQWATGRPEEVKAVHTFLAISGGGANGAFGAGILNGWTEAGTRPEFLMVTGTSTGALIAPFAFLGPEYDDILKHIYTTTTTDQIVKKRSVLKLITGDAFGDSAPLRALLEKYIDQDMMEAIAKEYRKGRRLLVGTTNLDAKRPVTWNIGAIAASGRPDALELIHDILLASASIPGAFPPVLIDVKADGQQYDEMHVDGGTASQVFLLPAQFNIRKGSTLTGLEGQIQVFVIRNAFVYSRYEAVRQRVAPIARISIFTLIRTQGIGDLYRLYLGADRDRLDFNLAYIPDDFAHQPKEEFDPEYMTALFNLGYQLAKDGYPWKKHPPGFEPPKDR